MSSKLNERLQIAAAISIVASLLLVGVQLNQNSELLKTQLLYEESNRMMTIEYQFFGEDPAEVWAKSIEDPENLTLAEQRVLEALLWNVIEQWRATRMLAELGLLEEEEWRPRVEGEADFYFGNRYGRAWWASYEGSNLQPDLRDAINAGLSTANRDFTPGYFQAIMDAMKSQKDFVDSTSE